MTPDSYHMNIVGALLWGLGQHKSRHAVQGGPFQLHIYAYAALFKSWSQFWNPAAIYKGPLTTKDHMMVVHPNFGVYEATKALQIFLASLSKNI